MYRKSTKLVIAILIGLGPIATYAQTALTPQELQEQRHLQQKQHAEERVQGIVQANDAAEMKRLLGNYENASNAQTSVQMRLELTEAEKRADASLRGRRITPELREELLAKATDIEKKIAKLQVAEENAIKAEEMATQKYEALRQKQAADAAARAKADQEAKALAKQNDEMIRQKQASDAAVKAKADKEALEEAIKNADISAYPACPAADDMLRPDGVGFRTWLELKEGPALANVKYACVQKEGFEVHTIIPGKEPAYEAALTKCGTAELAYYDKCFRTAVLGQ